ncbi:hypothetical protein JCM19000A_35630 [Silvimonas sp. JCM 19000]
MRRNGYSLVELAIVLVIIGLMLQGMLGAVQTLRQGELRRAERRQQDQIGQTLLAFAVRNGHLPCPAALAVSLGRQGLEARDADGRCSALQGTLPWRTLAVARVDAWQRPYTYRVSASFADLAPRSPGDSCAPNAKPPAGMSFMLCSSGDITLLDNVAAGNVIAQRIPLLLIAHGAHGPGALSGGGDGGQARNARVGSEFIVGAAPDEPFDDLLFWINNERLVEIALRAGRLP